MIPLFLAFLAPALAVEGEEPAAAQAPPKTLGDYLSELSTDENAERLYAARYVRGELKRALRAQASRPPGSTEELEARVVLTELWNRVPGSCAVALKYTNTAAPCAEMIADLEIDTMHEAVKGALSLDLSRGQRARIEKAIARLPPPAAPVAPADTTLVLP